MVNRHMKRGSLLLPSIYMVQNGSKIVGIILEISDSRVRILMNNHNHGWYDMNTVIDLFKIC